MATLSNKAPTLLDWSKSLDPDGSTAAVVELLSETNPILEDMGWMEGNLPTGHRTTVRTGLPEVYWRKLNQGVPGSKTTRAQVDEACAMLEAWCEVDKDLAELNGNTAEFRLSESQGFMEAMNQEMASTIFYGNSAIDTEEFSGLATRYSSLSAANGRNIIDCGGTGSDNASIWLVTWGPNALHGIFPKGSKMGLTHEDLGLVTVEATAGIAGNRLRAYQDHWQWKCGLALRDWRYCVRIANIDVSAIKGDTADNTYTTNIVRKMIQAVHRIPTLNKSAMGRPCFYVPRDLMEILDIQDLGNSAGAIKTSEVDGMYRSTFRGIPVKAVDALLSTEAQVT